MIGKATVLTVALGLLLPAAAIGQAFDSDDFNCPTLQAHWTFEDPTSGGSFNQTGSGSGDAWLELHLGAGTAHDAWGAGGDNESVRVMQSADDTDFTIEVHWRTEPTAGFNDQGILVEQDDDNWLRLDIYHNNSSLKAFMGKTVGGTNTTLLNANITAGSSLYMRVARSGDTWTMSLSADGNTYVQAGQFTQALNVARVGVYAANPVEGLAWTSEVDWFFDTSDPIDPEDPNEPEDCEGTVSVEASTWTQVKHRYGTGR